MRGGRSNYGGKPMKLVAIRFPLQIPCRSERSSSFAIFADGLTFP